jgi:hypothetical protein
MPLLDAWASYDRANDHGAVFLVNRSQQEAVMTGVIWLGDEHKSSDATHPLDQRVPKS